MRTFIKIGTQCERTKNFALSYNIWILDNYIIFNTKNNNLLSDLTKFCTVAL